MPFLGNATNLIVFSKGLTFRTTESLSKRGFCGPCGIPGTGLEPARISSPDPKSGVSANSTTRALSAQPGKATRARGLCKSTAPRHPSPARRRRVRARHRNRQWPCSGFPTTTEKIPRAAAPRSAGDLAEVFHRRHQAGVQSDAETEAARGDARSGKHPADGEQQHEFRNRRPATGRSRRTIASTARIRCVQFTASSAIAPCAGGLRKCSTAKRQVVTSIAIRGRSERRSTPSIAPRKRNSSMQATHRPETSGGPKFCQAAEGETRQTPSIENNTPSTPSTTTARTKPRAAFLNPCAGTSKPAISARVILSTRNSGHNPASATMSTARLK